MKARKQFGQHFLKDDYRLQEICNHIDPTPEDHLVEIGPGYGALTNHLIGSAKSLDLIEIDRDLVKILKRQYNHQAIIHSADALTFDFRTLKQDNQLRIVGNLPYNISTPLLFHLFQSLELIQDLHFLLQKEVVDRITAQPGGSHYGRLSVMTQFYCHPTALLTVGPEAFDPPPRVQSSLLRLIPKETMLPINSMEQFAAVVRTAFSYRRKTLRNSLKGWLSAEQLRTLGLDPQQRPQELSVENFIRISNAITVELKHDGL